MAIRRKPSPRGAARAAALPLADDAYQRLHGAIQAGELQPGMRLVERELAHDLGASRTPVRQALQRLEGDGLVARDPRRGMIVAQLDPSMVAELYVMREVLEGTAAALAARHASDGEIATLRVIASRDHGLARDPRKLAQNNRLFHEALYRSAHNRYLLRTVSALREAMALLGHTTLAIAGRSATALAEHERLLRALERRDPEAAEKAARAHIRSAYHARLTLLMKAA